MDPVVDPVDCPGCGVAVPRTGRRGRPRKLCAGCRATAKPKPKPKIYAAEFCLKCGEPLPANRNRQRVYCNGRCGNTAWVTANRAELKALEATAQ